LPEKETAYRGRVMVYAVNSEDAWAKVDKVMEIARREGIDIHIDNVEVLI